MYLYSVFSWLYYTKEEGEKEASQSSEKDELKHEKYETSKQIKKSWTQEISKISSKIKPKLSKGGEHLFYNKAILNLYDYF